MRAATVHTAIAALLLVTAACSMDRKELLAPAAPHKQIIYIGPSPTYPTLPAPLGPDAFVDITAGAYHTCARKVNGNVYCWGLVGGTVVQTPTLIWTGATQIDAGGEHTCGLNSSGAAYCWGDGNFGEIGVGAFGTGYLPSAVGGPGWGLPPLTFTSISAGQYSTCGTSPSGMYCWGEIVGQSPFPTQVSAFNGYSKVTVGYAHACAQYVVSGWSSVDCWGANNVGQAGYDPSLMSTVPFTVGSGLGSAVTRATTEYDFTCADQNSGVVQCFGDNSYGQLGNGQGGVGQYAWIPQTVGGGTVLHGVATGTSHACALGSQNTGYCWGANSNGQLGLGSTTNSYWPAAITGGHVFRAIAAGRLHSCAIGTDNHIYCWGNNGYRQLGTGLVDSNGNWMPIGGYSPNPVQAVDPTT